MADKAYIKFNPLDGGLLIMSGEKILTSFAGSVTTEGNLLFWQKIKNEAEYAIKYLAQRLKPSFREELDAAGQIVWLDIDSELYNVILGSQWDYDGSECADCPRTALTVFLIRKALVGDYEVGFKEIPNKMFSIHKFNGIVFKPTS